MKILDFGLARLLRREPTSPGHTTATETAAGAIVGTPPYMSPEQLLGKPPDARSDLYSAGAVLYEVATGRRPFGSRSGVALTDAILHEPAPSPRSTRPALSPGLEAALLKALEKDPELRYQTAKDLLVDLERLQVRSEARPDRHSDQESEGGPKAGAPPPLRDRRRRLALTFTAVAALLATVWAAFTWWAQPTRPPRVTGVRLLATFAFPLVDGSLPRIDGDRIYHITSKHDATVVRQISLSGGDLIDTPLPFRERDVVLFSVIPGGSALVVGTSPQGLRPNDMARPLWRLPLPAGAPQRLGDLLATSADVSHDGSTLAIIHGRSMILASVDGSRPHELRLLPQPAGWVRWTPDGTHLRYHAPGPHETREGWIWEIPATGGAPLPLWPGHMGGWTADGRHYVFDRPPGHDLFVVKESRWARWMATAPQPLTLGPNGYGFHGSSSDGGRLVVSSSPRNPIRRGTLMRYVPEQKRFEPAMGGESAFYSEPSPNAEWLAWVSYPEGTLWRSRPDGSNRLPLTGPPGLAHLPRWSADGTRLVFVSQPDPSTSQWEIRIVAADGSWGELIARPGTPGESYWDPCWLPDGSIVFSRLSLSQRGLFRYDPATRRVAALSGAEALQFPKCSRQGDLLAAAGRTWKVRRRGTNEWRDLGVFSHTYPSWRPDGSSVCALSSLSQQIECVGVEGGRMTPIADASSLELAAWVNVPWMGLDSKGQPFLTVESGGGGPL